MDAPNDNPGPPRWLHAWAVLTVAVTLPLLFLGAVVTTMDAGMIDPRGLRSPWHFFQGFLEDRGLAWIIEHGHRLLGFLVGSCAIVLAIGLWRKDTRPWVRWLGLIALLAVSLQGSLGIFRIELDALMGRSLALVHGAFAQIVFGLLISVVVVTSSGWTSWNWPVTQSPQLRQWSITTAALVYCQLVLGGIVRHKDHALAARSHILLAFVVLAAALWLAKLAWEHQVGHRAVKLLLALLAVQVVLGIESWLSKFLDRASPHMQIQPLLVHHEVLRSVHYLVGTLVFATSVVIALRAYQGLAWSPAAQAQPAAHVEGST